MALIRWEPARELQSVQNEINRLFNTAFVAPVVASQGPSRRRWIPAMDLVENEHDYVLRADLPGISEGDLKVEFKDNVLTVSGERKAEHEEQREGYRRIERSAGSFSRSLTLPDGVDPQAVTASFERGVLEVHIPKPQARKAQRIEIVVGGSTEATARDAEPTELAAAAA
jgi:HSP20 family protein